MNAPPGAVTALPERGLYAITDTTACARLGLTRAVAAAIAGGARVIQYRDKSDDALRRRAESRALLELCRDSAVPLIINDDVELALEIGADGVHVGEDDAAVADARHRLGPDAIVGASCYHHLALATQAHSAGASYVAFGRCFPSRSKAGAPLATPALLSEARTRIPLPIVAIGGIDASNGQTVLDAGADLLACILGVFGADDVTAAARRIDRLFDHQDAH